MDAPAYLLAEAVHLSNRRRRPTGSLSSDRATVQLSHFSAVRSTRRYNCPPPPSVLVFHLYNQQNSNIKLVFLNFCFQPIGFGEKDLIFLQIRKPIGINN